MTSFNSRETASFSRLNESEIPGSPTPILENRDQTDEEAAREMHNALYGNSINLCKFDVQPHKHAS